MISPGLSKDKGLTLEALEPIREETVSVMDNINLQDRKDMHSLKSSEETISIGGTGGTFHE